MTFCYMNHPDVIKICTECKAMSCNNADVCKRFGVEYRKIVQRIQQENKPKYQPGEKRERKKPYRTISNRRYDKTYTYNGITDTIKGWSERLHIAMSTMYKRLYENDDPDMIFREEPPRPRVRKSAQIYEIDGKKYTVKQLAEMVGITRMAMYDRLKKMTAEQAISYGYRQGRKVDANELSENTPG